jgi:hypothetical protein
LTKRRPLDRNYFAFHLTTLQVYTKRISIGPEFTGVERDSPHEGLKEQSIVATELRQKGREKRQGRPSLRKSHKVEEN